MPSLSNDAMREKTRRRPEQFAADAGLVARPQRSTAMKRRLPVGSLEIPDDWEDRTTYQFVSPPAQGLNVPMAAGRGVSVGSARTSVLVSRLVLPEKTSLDEYLRQQVDELRRALPSLVVNSHDSWPHPTLGSVAALDVTFEVGPGMTVRQLQFYLPLVQTGICANMTVSVAAGQFEQKRSDIQTLLAGFQPS
jgi:hypothetical protein